MGNGNFGAIIWGKDTLNITVNRSDFWDHRGGELIVENNFYRKMLKVADKSKEEIIGLANSLHKPTPEHIRKPQRIPVGRFEFKFADNVLPEYAELNYNSGEVSVILSDKAVLKINMAISENYLFIDDPAKTIKDFMIKPSWDFEKSRSWLSRLAFSAPKYLNEKNLKGWAICCPGDDPALASVCGKENETFLIALELGKDDKGAFDKAKKKLSSLEKKRAVSEAKNWWENYWSNIPEIDIPDKFLNEFYRYALYKFAGATNPAGYACGLQGPWHEEYQDAQWGGDYHVNVNIQQIYTLAFPIGKYEHLMPLFDMIDSERFTASLRTNAESMFGIKDGLWITHAVDDRGEQVGGLGPGAILDPACTVWLAQLYWLYYKYTGDKDFLVERAYPFICGIMRCFEEMLVVEDGKYVIPFAISAEYASSNPKIMPAGKNPSNQLYAVHMLLNYLIEICDILGFEPKNIWLDIKKKLPKYTVIDGLGIKNKPEKHIAIWEGQDLDNCHRHHSHLACVYPFDILRDFSEADMEILDDSIDHWISKGFGLWSEWCIPWAAIILSRLGINNAPHILFNIWKENYINEGMTTVYLPRMRGLVVHRKDDMRNPIETNEIMQLDGTMGAASAIIEMLVHQKGDTVYLFKGIPASWENVAFKRVRLPGTFEISARRKNGELASLKIRSYKGGTINIELNGKRQELKFGSGEEKQLIDV